MELRLGRKLHRAFTIIELLLVMVILATLAAIILPRFTGKSKQAKITAARADIANLQTALDAFEIEAGRFPTTEEGLTALVEQPADIKGWGGPYLPKSYVPKDPWGNPYSYQQPGDHNTAGYDLSSNGPDGQEGTDDDIDNWSER